MSVEHVWISLDIYACVCIFLFFFCMCLPSGHLLPLHPFAMYPVRPLLCRPTLLRLVGDGARETLREAAAALANLARSAVAQVTLVALGARPTLLRLLDAGAPEAPWRRTLRIR